ncbi:Protein SDA1 homolog [Gryllus bimaculatus]|nr:Protein SDA1 homolog [Gryllus bimaculatus]
MTRHNNQLPDNLPQLQNLIKRDPASYRDEFIQQYQHYKSLVQVFRLHPTEFNKKLDELVMFLSQVSHCYPQELTNYPQELVDLLQTNLTVLDSDMRMTFCRALILLRNKNMLNPTDLLSLFFQLLACPDKSLRSFLQTHIVTDIKNQNAKHKNSKLNTTLQNFMYSMLKDTNAKAAKMSVDIMIDLYKKNIWNDAKTVNVIVTACFSKFTKVMVAALKFFLGSDNEEDEEKNDSDSDLDVDPKAVLLANRVNKKTKKRDKQVKKVKKLVKKHANKKSKAPVFNFSGLHLVHDPQGMAEKLFAKLERSNERFEVKLMILDVVSRLIGLHQLFLFNYYPYIQRFMQPHQREVTRIMQFAAQSSHELVPPEVIEPMLKTLVNNFVTERNSSDAIAMGLNAVREVCIRCPLAMNADLLQDLAQYQKYRERSVVMAARSLIHLFRTTCPLLLNRKDRGRPTEATVELKLRQYGEIDAPSYVVGAEEILKEKKKGDDNNSNSDCDSSDDDSDGWIDISSEEDTKPQKSSSNGNKIAENKKNADKPDFDCSDSEEEAKEVNESNKVEMAAMISTTRLLTDEDFKRIEAAQIRKEIIVPQKSKGKGQKRLSSQSVDAARGELVKLSDIENIHKKKKHDKEARIESVRRGQQDRQKFGFQDQRLNPFCSKTNREKKKNKHFNMVKHKAKAKVKRSFKEKQIALRNHLLKLKKMK